MTDPHLEFLTFPFLSPQSLQQCFPQASASSVALYTPLLDEACEEYQINTLPRIRMFLAQLGHESGQLRYVEELASGKAYEGRLDLGNTQPGDGVRYKGRGLIQLTGRDNYTIAGLALDLPLLEKPELLSLPRPGCLVSAWFWKNNNLSRFADSDDFRGLTKAINGGYNGLENRLMLYQRCCEYLK